jgi:hypothetical protein
MTLETRVETKVGPKGEVIEIATVTFEGKDFTAMGSYTDEERGILHAYICGIPGAYTLQTFGGVTLAPAKLVCCFGGFPVKMYAWRAVFNGRIYSGRNSGPGMLVRMRGGKVVAS